MVIQVVFSKTEKEIIIMIVDILSVFYYEKWWVTYFQSFADLVFVSERIDVGLKRGKFNYSVWTNEKTGANKDGDDEGEIYAVIIIFIRLSFLLI